MENFASRRFIVAAVSALAFLIVAPSVQAKPTLETEREVAHLLNLVAKPGCRFNRNGKWYGGAAARQHLKEKYDYLVNRDMVTTTETFIERAASTSSVTGQAYLVQCGSAAPSPSGPWLRQELLLYRK